MIIWKHEVNVLLFMRRLCSGACLLVCTFMLVMCIIHCCNDCWRCIHSLTRIVIPDVVMLPCWLGDFDNVVSQTTSLVEIDWWHVNNAASVNFHANCIAPERLVRMFLVGAIKVLANIADYEGTIALRTCNANLLSAKLKKH